MVPQDHIPDLLCLIRFRFGSFGLQTQNHLNTRYRKDVMFSFDPFVKTETS